jgi:histidinol-phosphate aminotransferase
VPLAMATPGVFVVRTFSKAFGMAGMRIGYAVGQADTIRQLARFKMPYNVSNFGIVAAITALADTAHMDAERRRNTEVRKYTVKALTDLGAKPTASEGNFLFVDLGGPSSSAFRDGCARAGVSVGRDFPPFASSHSRISLGTMDEMKRACEVFRAVLKPTTSSGGGR